MPGHCRAGAGRRRAGGPAFLGACRAACARTNPDYAAGRDARLRVVGRKCASRDSGGHAGLRRSRWTSAVTLDSGGHAGLRRSRWTPAVTLNSGGHVGLRRSRWTPAGAARRGARPVRARLRMRSAAAIPCCLAGPEGGPGGGPVIPQGPVKLRPPPPSPPSLPPDRSRRSQRRPNRRPTAEPPRNRAVPPPSRPNRRERPGGAATWKPSM